MPILNNLFQKIEEEGTTPNSFYEANISLIQKLDKEEKNYTLLICLMRIDAEILNKIFQIEFSNI